MGLDFRSGSYRRYVRLGKRTVKDGECACVWYMDGTCKQIIGPALVRLFYANIRFLDRFAATSTQYLKISFVDGHCEHVAGPISMYLNPVIHTSITIEDFHQLKSSNESIVVYSRVHEAAPTRMPAASAKTMIGHTEPDVDEATDSLSSALVRRVISGPHSFMPSTYDEVHVFRWHAAKEEFRILQKRQEFRGIAVPIKTKNNEEATIRLDVNIRIEDVEMLVDATANLPLTVSKGLAADLVPVGSSLSYTNIRSTVSGLVASPSSSFPILGTKLAAAGCALESLIFLGFEASEDLLAKYRAAEAAALKKARDDDEERRGREVAQARQRAELEKVKQDEQISDMKVAAARKRVEKEHELTELKSDFKARIERKEELARRDLEGGRVAGAVNLLRELKELDVDITSFLSAAAAGKGEGGEEKGLAAELGGFVREGVLSKVEFVTGGGK